MGNDRIRLVERVAEDWASLAVEERELVLEALRTIDGDPIAGVPLFDPLRGYWSFRVKWLRLIYRIEAQARFVVILKITRAAETTS